VLVVAQDAEGGNVEIEGTSSFDVQVHPRDGDRAKEVPVREGKNATLDGRGLRHEVHGPRADLSRRLTAWATVLVQLPARTGFVDGLGGQALVFAVFDLAKQRRDLGVGESSDLGRVPGTLQRARVHGVEVELGEAVAQGCGLLLAVRCERQIGASSVAAVDAPLGLAMTGEIDLEAQAGLPIISGLPERSDRLALSMTAPARTRWPGRTHTKPTVA
jgi:hypothetical protein